MCHLVEHLFVAVQPLVEQGGGRTLGDRTSCPGKNHSSTTVRPVRPPVRSPPSSTTGSTTANDFSQTAHANDFAQLCIILCKTISSFVLNVVSSGVGRGGGVGWVGSKGRGRGLVGVGCGVLKFWLSVEAQTTAQDLAAIFANGELLSVHSRPVGRRLGWLSVPSRAKRRARAVKGFLLGTLGLKRVSC